MSALLFSAVGGTRGKASVALTADGLLAVESLREKSQRGIVDTSSQSQDQVKRGLLLDIVVGQGSAVL